MARRSSIVLPTRIVALVAAVLSLTAGFLWAPTAQAERPAAAAKATVEVYDDFGRAGYSLADYGQKWSNPYAWRDGTG